MRWSLVCLVLFACGNDEPAGPPATVTVSNEGNPVTNAKVVFHGVAEVDAPNGRASHNIPRGATITAARRIPTGSSFDPTGGYVSLSTIVGANPGDDLTVGTPASAPAAGAMTVSAPARPGATHYNFSTVGNWMDTPTPTATLQVPAEAVTGGQVTFLATSSDGMLTMATVPFVNGGTVDLPDWTQGTPFIVNVQNVPAGGTELDVSVSAATSTTALDGFEASAIPATAFQQTFALPPGNGFPYQAISAHFFTTGDSLWGQVGMFQSPLTLDLSQLLPVPQSSAINGSTVTWQASGPTAAVQGMRIFLSWGQGNVWDITLPPASSLDLPALPADLGDLRPDASLTIAAIEFVRSDRLRSYDDYRPIAYNDRLLFGGASTFIARGR